MSAASLVALAGLISGSPAVLVVSEDLPTIRLSISDRFGFADQFLAHMGAEIEAAFAEVGVEAEWSLSEDERADHAESAPEAVASADAVSFRVLLAGVPPEAWNVKNRAMGIAVPTESVRRQVIVFPTRVLSVMGVRRPPGGAGAAFYKRPVARAFARVVVHELVHALAPGLSHAETGLMRGTLDRMLLERSDLTLDQDSENALRSALRAIP
jgi:hypothetical protein